MATGRLFVVSGPSGAGKGTVLSHVRKRRPDLGLSISATTRAPREGEIDGVHYHFKTQQEFQDLVEHDGFLEWASVHGNLYGTLRSEVDKKLREGSLVLEIDPQGALSVRQAMPSCVMIFIAPPSFEVLKDRLIERGTESAESLSLRLQNARIEMTSASEYNAVVINDDLMTCVQQVLDIIAHYEEA